VAPGVPADGARVGLGQVAADPAEPDLLPDVADRRRQGGRVLAGGAQDVEGQPGGGLLADAGQLAQLLHQPGDGRREHPAASRQLPNMPGGSGSPPVARDSSACTSSRARSRAMFTAPTTRSSIIFTLSGPPPSAGSMRIDTTSPLPVATQRTMPPPVSPSTVLPARSSRTRATSAWIRCAVSISPFKSGIDIRS